MIKRGNKNISSIKFKGKPFAHPLISSIPDAGGDNIPAFDNTFVGEFSSPEGDKIGRYNYITGEILVDIENLPIGSRFLSYNYIDDYYYIHTKEHPVTAEEGEDDWVCVYNSTGELINAITINTNAGICPAKYNPTLNKLLVVDIINGVPIEGVGSLALYNSDLTQELMRIDGVDEVLNEFEYNRVPFLIEQVQDMGFIMHYEGTIVFIDENGNRQVVQVFDENVYGFYYYNTRLVNKQIYQNENGIYIILFADSDNSVSVVNVKTDGTVETIHNLGNTSFTPYPIFINENLIPQPNTSSYGMYNVINNEILIPNPTPGDGFTGPGYVFYIERENKVLYATWEGFTYEWELETGEVAEIEYGQDSFHRLNQAPNSQRLFAYPAIELK